MAHGHVPKPSKCQPLSSSKLHIPVFLCFTSSPADSIASSMIHTMHCRRDCHPLPPEFCSTICTTFPKCSTHCFDLPKPPILVSPPPPPPPPHPPLISQGKHLLLLSLITTATLVSAIFMVCLLVKKLREWRNSRPIAPALFLFDVPRQNSPDHHEEGPPFDHHVWYINTVGLQQSVIDSITMFKYRKDQKLIDGSDCSICLGEFQDDESLRLLPKCSHAFHLPCIDTWLRSHMNCPLCRAPVVSNSAAPSLTPIEPITNHPPPPTIEDAQMEAEAVDEENRGEEGSNGRENSEIPSKGVSRTLSNLTENQNREAVENEGQAMRRWVSMDLGSAMAIYQATADIQIPEEGCSSNGALVEVKNSVSTSRNVPFLPKRGSGNQSLYNLVKTISFVAAPKGAISRKRFSSGRRKLRWARHYRSQSSVLPL